MKLLSLFLLSTILSFSVSAQKVTKSKSKPGSIATKKSIKKKVAPVREAAENMILSSGEGLPALFTIQPMDTLVYGVEAYGKKYDFIIIVNKYEGSGGIDFNWKMTDPINTEGHTTVTGEAAYSSKKYNNFFSPGELNLTDATTVWLCGENFSDMPEKKTTMQLDDNAPETFVRPDEDQVVYDIIYRGTPLKLDAFKINNQKEGADKKEIHILGISSNPLIVAMDLGWKIQLKEVR